MKKGQATRQRILAEAAPLFNQRGFHGCSMHDIMEATGMEKGGLYRHFSSKEELAADAFRYALERTVKTRTESLEAVTGAIAKLRYFMQQFVEKPSPLPGGCPLMNTAIDADDGNPLLRFLVAQAFQEWRSRLCSLVEEGMRTGEIDAQVRPRQIANTVMACLEGALALARLEESSEPLQDALASLELLVEGLRARRPGSALQEGAVVAPR